MRIWLGIIGVFFALAFGACENFSFAPTLPISNSISGQVHIDSSGTFSYLDNGEFFTDEDLDDVLGNIKSLSLDSLFLVIDSASSVLNDSLPFISAHASANLDTIRLDQSFNGSVQALKKLKRGIKINASIDELIQVSILLKDRANDNQNTPWSLALTGNVNGAPLTIYFRLKFYGEIEIKPAELI